MTPQQLLTKTGEMLYGTRWHAPIARDLGVSERIIYYWLEGRMPKRPLNKRLDRIISDRIAALETVRSELGR